MKFVSGAARGCVAVLTAVGFVAAGSGPSTASTGSVAERRAKVVVGDAATGRLEVGLGIDSPTVGSSTQVAAHLSMRNVSSGPVSVLTWGTPFDGGAHDSFRVDGHDGRVAYTGAVAKVAPPTAANYRTLRAGAILSADVDLSSAYAIDAPGAYRAQLSFVFGDVRRGDNLKAPRPAHQVSVVTPTLAFSVSGAGSAVRSASPRFSIKSFSGCTSGEQTTINTAYASVQNLVADAKSKLQLATNPATAPRYTTWFGAYNGSRYAAVQSHYDNINSLVTTNSVSSLPWSCNDAGCSSGTFAYVFPSDTTFTVHLCSEFFAAPPTGADSQPGVIVHEMSHFTALAGTDDFVYGQVDATALAVSNPSQAIMNADNHEYFAENPTALTMGNLRPSALGQSVTALAGQSTGVTLAGADPDSNTLTYSVATGPAHGTLSGTAPNLMYTPTAPFATADSLTFVVNDGQADSAPATVDITIALGNVTTVSIGSASIVEGTGGAGRAMVFPVTLNKPVTGLMTVDYAVASTGSASLTADISFKPGTLQFKPSPTTGLTKTAGYITVKIVADSDVEGDETFSMVIQNATLGVVVAHDTGIASIIDDDPAVDANTRVSVGDGSMWEGNTGATAKSTNNAKLFVHLSAPAVTTVSVVVTVSVGTASEGTDVKKVFTKTLTFNARQFQKPVAIALLPDGIVEPDETVTVTLSDPQGALSLGRKTGTLTILNDD